MNNLLISQFQSSKWSAEPIWLESFITRVSQQQVSQAMADIEVAVPKRSFSVVGGTAIIEISGVLLKTVPAWLRFWGIEATGYDEIRAQLGEAMADDAIDSIHLQVSSPGGIVDGLVDTADAIYNARKTKKVTATVEDLTASAAYWLTSQAGTIDAGRTAEIGSIGVYTVYLDSSKLADDMGFKVVLIKSGEHKGMGVAGVEITAEQIAAVQGNIDAIADQFIDSVARGRSRDAADIRKLATGQLWIAAEARKLGLIDRVTTIESQNSSNNNQTLGDQVMKDKNTEKDNVAEIETATTAAVDDERTRMTQIRTEFADDPEFALKACTEGWDLDRAKAEYCGVLRDKLKTKAAETKQETKANGAAPIVTDDSDDSDDGGDFMAQAKAMAAEQKISVTAAMKKLNRQNPTLHTAFLQSSQAGGRQAYYQSA